MPCRLVCTCTCLILQLSAPNAPRTPFPAEEEASQPQIMHGATVPSPPVPPGAFFSACRRTLLLVRSLSRLPSRLRHLKFVEIKTRRDRAADERPVAQRLCVLPFSPLHNHLWSLAAADVGAENYVTRRLAIVPGE